MAREDADFQAPDPAMVTASRRHLTSGYAAGVDRLLWELEKRPLSDTQAVNAVIDEHRTGRPVDALSIGMALVLVQSMRLELDCLETEVLDAALGSGMCYESLAAALDLPDGAAARRRKEYLDARRELPRTPGSPPQPAAHDLAEAAAKAGRRAGEAASRARSAARRREELGAGLHGGQAGPAGAERAATRASEARQHLSDATERVAAGLLRAASALDKAAAKYLAIDGGAGDALLGRKAQDCTDAARRYREMAARYLDIGGTFKPADG